MADLTPHARKKIEAFDTAAQGWGWEADQGNGPSVDASQNAYITAKNDLEQYVAGLIKKTKKKS